MSDTWNRTQPKYLQFRLFFAVNLFILAPTDIIFAMCILFKLDITLEAVALLGLRSARVVILIWEHIAPSEWAVHTILNILAGDLPYSYSIYFTIERGNTLIPCLYTQHIAPREREGTYSYLERCAPTILIHMEAAHLPSQIWPRHLLSPHSRPNQVPTNATGARVFWKPHSARIPSRLLGSFF